MHGVLDDIKEPLLVKRDDFIMVLYKMHLYLEIHKE